MKIEETKRIVTVLTSGRSGSSVLMQILERLGIMLSSEMIPGRLENPGGYFEDTQIVEVHKKLINDLGAGVTTPMPDGWLKTSFARRARQELSQIIENRMNKAQGKIWGFKDPRTTVLLPLWTKVFNLANVVPIYILSVRDPSTVAMSLKRQVNRDGDLSELQWLVRICDAIHQTAADFFIIHYEDLFRSPQEIVQELIEYIRFDDAKIKDIPSIVGDIIKPNLNRAVYDDYTVQNDQVRRLYHVLKECHGTTFDRERLMEAVKDCRFAIRGFKGWADQVHELTKQKQKDQQKITQAGDKKKLEELTVLNSTYLKENIALKECLSEAMLRAEKAQTDLLEKRQALDSLTMTLKVRESELSQIEMVQKKFKSIQNSEAYRVGLVLVMAIKKPGKNTVLLPFRLLRLVIGNFGDTARAK